MANVGTKFILDEDFGLRFIKWFGDNILHMNYDEEAECYVGKMLGKKVVVYFEHTILNENNNKRFDKYKGYHAIELTIYNLSRDNEDYIWDAHAFGLIEPGFVFRHIGDDTEFSDEIYEILREASAKYNMNMWYYEACEKEYKRLYNIPDKVYEVNDEPF